MRDPRKDPRPGDVVRKGAFTRQALSRRGERFAMDYYDQARDKVVRMIALKTWKTWARGAEVLHVAEA